MSRYVMIRRLRGPAFLLLVGVLALLNQADILSWGKSWPFFLILAGLLVLAERAAPRHILSGAALSGRASARRNRSEVGNRRSGIPRAAGGIRRARA